MHKKCMTPEGRVTIWGNILRKVLTIVKSWRGSALNVDIRRHEIGLEMSVSVYVVLWRKRGMRSHGLIVCQRIGGILRNVWRASIALFWKG